MSEKAGDRDNNLGALRLGLALLVIAAHAPELIDGDRRRELLTLMFGTLSFGELAVDGFFLISGFLIVRSWLSSASLGDFLVRRALRIYPGFVVAYAFSLWVGWLCGGDLSILGVDGISGAATRIMLLLPPPNLTDAFGAAAEPALNGSLGTIAYEFRCYLLIPLLAGLGLLGRRRLVLSLAIGATTLGAIAPHISTPLLLEIFFGDPTRMLRYAGVFLLGASAYLYRDRFDPGGRTAGLAAAALALLMFTPLAWIATPTLGGVALYWLAFRLRAPGLRRVGRETDISYGVYLYAWPLTNALIYLKPGIHPGALTFLVAAAALVLGWASWRLVESPAMGLKSRLKARYRERASAT